MYITTNLTEKELLNDLMSSEKQMSISYGNAITESSCPVLREIFAQCLERDQEIQYSIYDAVDRRGWNKIKLVNKRDIESTLSTYKSVLHK